MAERTADSAIVSGSLTRRQVIAGGTVGLCGLAITGVRADAQSATSPNSNEIIATHAIHQVEDFKASPQRIYGALLDSKQFTAFSSGAAAEIDGKVGGTFSIFAGHIIGRNLELVPNQRIVQAWRVVPWPAGIYSIARFELAEQGSGTRLTFDHTGFPSELAEHLLSGWNEHYWEPLRKYLG